MQQNSKRFYIYFGAAILVLALIFGAGATAWLSSDTLLAAQNAQDTTTQIADTLSASQMDLAAQSPSQEVLHSLYAETSPSVVNIQVTITSTATTLPGLPEGLPFGAPNGGQGMQMAQGSGFIYDMDGHIVTNNHVVESAQDITVYFENGMWSDATVVATDPQADLAVLKVDVPEGVDWTPLPLADANSLLPGYYVIAVGSPFGLDETMTLGVVSAMGRAMATGDSLNGSRYSLPDVIQTDTAINPGNSGGPLMNLNGEVVGVNYAINTTSGSNSGVGFAIPVSVVQKVVPALISDGSFDYSYLGIAGQTITEPVAKEFQLPSNELGVFVADVVSGGPASKAGVETNDIIVGIGDAKVTQFEDLISYLFSDTNPGTNITLSVVRDGKPMDLNVELSARPSASEETAMAPESGDTISIAEAINIAKSAVADSELMNSIDSANAKHGTADGSDVWIVTLTGQDKSATVTVDAHTGKVLELTVD